MLVYPEHFKKLIHFFIYFYYRIYSLYHYNIAIYIYGIDKMEFQQSLFIQSQYIP